MKRLFVQFLLLLGSFLFVWFLLSQVAWLDLLRIEKISRQTEEKLGEIFWDVFKRTETEVTVPNLVQPVDSLLKHLCEGNNIKAEKIRVHLIRKDEVNAFALPGGRIVVFTGLIKACQNEAELSGVLGHEMAHLQHNHVSRKLVKEVGLSVLVSMAGGNAGGQVIKETLKLLSSTAYDRELEKEADLAACEYLINATLDPGPFANFLSRLSEEHHSVPEILVWTSTHPDPNERATYIRNYIRDKPAEAKKVLSTEAWKAMQEGLQ